MRDRQETPQPRVKQTPTIRGTTTKGEAVERESAVALTCKGTMIPQDQGSMPLGHRALKRETENATTKCGANLNDKGRHNQG